MARQRTLPIAEGPSLVILQRSIDDSKREREITIWGVAGRCAAEEIGHRRDLFQLARLILVRLLKAIKDFLYFNHGHAPSTSIPDTGRAIALTVVIFRFQFGLQSRRGGGESLLPRESAAEPLVLGVGDLGEAVG